MAYLVLARKYRPQTFDGLIGQEHVSVTLKNAINGKRIAHSYLFSGPRGCGKTSAARIFAKAVNCLQPEKNPGEPCNECEVCKEVTGGSSLDVIEIDGASNRGIDEIRNLRENVKYTPIRCKYKVYIIDEVHMLTEPAFNALLKTLEEPPEHIIFIFATTEPHSVPVTILSRCQRYDFKRIPVPVIATHLKKLLEAEKTGFEEDALIEIARNAEGSLRDSLTLLDQLIAFSAGKIQLEDVRRMLGLVRTETYADFFGFILSDAKEDGLKMIQALSDNGQDFVAFFTGFMEFLRDVMVLQVTEEGKGGLVVDASSKDIEIMRDAGKKTGQSIVYPLMDLVSEALKELKFSNSLQVQSEIIFFKLVDLVSRKSTASSTNRQNMNRTASQTGSRQNTIQTSPKPVQTVENQQYPNQSSSPETVPPPGRQSSAQSADDVMKVSTEMFAKYLPGDKKKSPESPIVNGKPPLQNGAPDSAPGTETGSGLEISRETGIVEPTPAPVRSYAVEIISNWDAICDSLAAKGFPSFLKLKETIQLEEGDQGRMRFLINRSVALNIINTPDNLRVLRQELFQLCGTRVEPEFVLKPAPVSENQGAEKKQSDQNYVEIFNNAVKLFGGSFIK